MSEIAAADGESPQLEDRLVVFIDLLGFSAATQPNAPDKNKQILEMLSALARASGDYRFVEMQVGDNAWETTLVPAATAFSDNIVLSIPFAQPKTEAFVLHPVTFTQYAVNRLRNTVGLIAARALQLGFLIRGGMAHGKLYHRGGIVFGEAMLRAYEVERRVAHFPRVAVSPEVVSLLEGMKLITEIVQDRDGIHCLNYFTSMFFGPLEQFQQWTQFCRNQIASQIGILRAQGRLNELAKWCWFQETFNEVMNGKRAQL